MPGYDDPNPETNGRVVPGRARGRGDRTHTVIVARPGRDDGDGIDDPPTDGGPPFEGQNPRDTNLSNLNRLASKAADREFTGHPAEGPVGVPYGPNMPIGGKWIFYKRLGGTHYFDMGLGEGPIDSVTVKFGDFTPAQVHVTTEIHLGVPGDTGSALINALADPAYTVPEGIAHVVFRYQNPAQDSPSWSPFDFKATVNGRVLYNPYSAATEMNGIPISAAWDALTNTVYGGKQSAGRMNGGEWASEQLYSETEIDAGIKRWEFSLFIDQQDTLKNWLDVILRYSNAHLRYYGGQFGVYSERPRAPALKEDATEIILSDSGLTTDNASALFDFIQSGTDEIPTVVTADYTDAANGFVTASVQVPAPEDFDPALDWIEIRLALQGVTTIERAQRHATQEYLYRNLCDKDVTAPLFFDAIRLIPGDRVRVASRKLIGATETPPNADGIMGMEDMVVADVKMGTSPVARLGLYREAVYGPASIPEPPNPPDPPPDPDDTPDCPEDLVALFSDPSEYGMIEFAPPASGEVGISKYDVYDIFTGSVLVGSVNPPGDPIGFDGKYHKSFPALVHTDPDGDVHLAVRVVSVSYASNVATGCASTSWDVTGEATTGTCDCIATSCELEYADVPDGTYDQEDYHRILAPTKLYNTTLADATGDFFVSTSTNANGIIWAKAAGQYYVSATVGWEASADSALRALSFIYIYAGGRRIGKLSVAITSAGTGYTTGQALSVTGSPAAGGVPLTGTILATAGGITGLALVGGIGYTSAPTVTILGGGSGGVLTASLPAAFTIADLDFDCSVLSTIVGGQLVAEDIIPAVNDAACPTRQHLGVSLPIEQYGGVLVCVQQHSGGNLDLIERVDPASEFVDNWHAASLFSMHKISTDKAPVQIRTCHDPE